MLQLVHELRNESKTVMSWCSRKKKSIFVTFTLSEGFILGLISMYSILNKVLKYIYFYLSKNSTLYTFGAFFLNSRKASVYP